MPGPVSNDILVAFDAAPGTDIVGMVLPLLIMGTIFYFLVLRPQQQERAKVDAMLAAIVKDDEIVTTGGLHGKVVAIDGEVLVVEISEKTRVRIDRSAVSRKGGVDAVAKK